MCEVATRLISYIIYIEEFCFSALQQETFHTYFALVNYTLKHKYLYIILVLEKKCYSPRDSFSVCH